MGEGTLGFQRGKPIDTDNPQPVQLIPNGEEMALRSPAPGVPVVATIASGAAISSAIDLGVERAHRLAFPAAWTAAVVTFQTSADGATFNDLYDQFGEITLGTAAASRSILMPQEAFFGVRYLKVRSGTSASPVNQAAARSLTLVTVPR